MTLSNARPSIPVCHPVPYLPNRQDSIFLSEISHERRVENAENVLLRREDPYIAQITITGRFAFSCCPVPSVAWSGMPSTV